MPWLFEHFTGDCGRLKETGQWNRFIKVFLEIGELIANSDRDHIDDIATRLIETGLVAQNLDEHALACVRYAIFSMLGWQTMLYKPAKTNYNPAQFSIEDEQEEYRGQGVISLHQPMDPAARETLSEMLMGFGVMLPAKNMCLSEDTDEERAFHQQVDISPRRFNASLMISIAGIQIKWIDTLSCHMEYNPAMKELYLFRFPSFCLSCLGASRAGKRSVIHACATVSNLHCQWASEGDVDCMLRETILSYRLLFGQSKKSRALFGTVDPFAGCQPDIRDHILRLLCSKRSCPVDIPEREIYYLPRDFPILRYRISVLQRHLSKTAPRTWAQLWSDKRDSAHWLTFWAVIFFGAAGTFFALLQAVLQLAQLLIR